VATEAFEVATVTDWARARRRRRRRSYFTVNGPRAHDFSLYSFTN
jgi:hypothetical protein